MVDFIDEVNEELRRERLRHFWDKMGRYIAGVAVFIVGVTVASVLWKNYSESRQEQAALEYLEAEKLRVARQSAEAAEAFESVAEGKAGGYPALAKLKQASALRDLGKKTEAQAVYTALANDRKADEGLRAFARIYAAQLKSEAGAEFSEVEAWLKPLLSKNNSAFAPLAKEQLAFAALAADDAARAKTLFDEIVADSRTSASLKQRATAQASTLADGLDASAEKVAAAAE